MDTESPFFSLQEAASFARCSTRTVQRWLDSRKLSRHGHGRRLLIRKVELKLLLSPTHLGEGSA